MALPPNVEKCKFFPGTYTAYDGKGAIWRVSKVARIWKAKPGPSNKARELGIVLEDATLTKLAALLLERKPPAPLQVELPSEVTHG